MPVVSALGIQSKKANAGCAQFSENDRCTDTTPISFSPLRFQRKVKRAFAQCLVVRDVAAWAIGVVHLALCSARAVFSSASALSDSIRSSWTIIFSTCRMANT